MVELAGPRRFRAPGVESMHWLAEIEKRAFHDRNRWLGDPAFAGVRQSPSATARACARSSATIDPAPGDADGRPLVVARRETHDDALLGRRRRRAWRSSVTTTLNDSFGSARVAPGLGFLWNNEMDDFATRPGEPNLYGLVQGEVNAVAPGKRMLSSMCPSIASSGGKLVLVWGSPGGSTIPTTNLQVLLAQSGCAASRSRRPSPRRASTSRTLPDAIQIERGRFDDAWIAALRTMGHEIREREKIGRVHAIAVEPDGTLHAVGGSARRRRGARRPRPRRRRRGDPVTRRRRSSVRSTGTDAGSRAARPAPPAGSGSLALARDGPGDRARHPRHGGARRARDRRRRRLRRRLRDAQRRLDAAGRAVRDGAAAARRRRARPPSTSSPRSSACRRRFDARRAGASPEEIEDALIREADAIAAEDIEACRRIGRLGAELLPGETRGPDALQRRRPRDGRLRHARSASSGARSRRASRSASSRCETRPFLQGARLTAWELVARRDPGRAHHRLRWPATSSPAASVEAVVVGADRIAANGDVANKIGTYSLAVLAKENGIPVLRRGADDDRRPRMPGRRRRSRSRSAAGSEVLSFAGQSIAPAGVGARYAAFDVTPARYISAIVTDRAICRPPYGESLRRGRHRRPPEPQSGYNGVMKNARISELRDGLSDYLARVRKGETVIVYDRDTPIARIEPIAASDAAELARVGARGANGEGFCRRRRSASAFALPPPIKTRNPRLAPRGAASKSGARGR